MKIAIESKTYRIWELIDLIDDGDLVLPSVQRDFEWTDKDVTDFLESILKEHPLGPQFFFWVPNDDEISAVYSNARGIYGTFLDKDNEPEDIKFVIDGQQRITSAFRVLTGNLPIAFDPVAKRFKKVSEADIRTGKLWPSPKATMIPLEELRSLTVKEIFEKSSNAFNLEKNADLVNDELIKNLKFFLRVFQNLEFDAKILKNYSYSETSEIFVNLNKKGKKVSSLDSIVAPALLEKVPDFKEKTSKFVEEIKRDFPGFEGLVDHSFIVLNTLYSLQGYAGSTHGIKDVESITKETINTAFNSTIAGIRQVLLLLKSELGINTSTMIPVTYPVHVLSVAYGKFKLGNPDPRANPTAQERKAAILYFLISNLTARYSDKGHNEVRKADMDLTFGNFSNESTNPFMLLGKAVMNNRNKGIQKDRWVIREEIEKAELTKSGNFLFPLLGIVLKKKNAPAFNDGNGGIDFRDSHKHHIFPRAKVKLYSPEYIARMNNIANITFVHGDPNKFEFSDRYPSEYLKELSSFKGSSDTEIKEALGKHFIPSDEKLWEIEKFDEFLNYRTHRITEEMNLFIENYIWKN